MMREYPEQPVGLRLPTGFTFPHARRFDFAYEKGQLLKILGADWRARTADAWKPHPIFGKMTPTEWESSCRFTWTITYDSSQLNRNSVAASRKPTMLDFARILTFV